MRLYSAARGGVNLTLSPAEEVVKRTHMIIHTACTEPGVVFGKDGGAIRQSRCSTE